MLDLLEKQGALDRDVLIGSDENERVPVRLPAFPVPEEVANLRRMKAKKEMRGHAPSSQWLALMSWSIFFVTFPNESANPSTLDSIESFVKSIWPA